MHLGMASYKQQLSDMNLMQDLLHENFHWISGPIHTDCSELTTDDFDWRIQYLLVI